MDVIKWQLNFESCNFGLKSYLHHAYDFRPNCTPLSSITIINCSHTVHNLIRVNSRIHRCPQNRISDRSSQRGLRPLLFPNSVWVRPSHTSTVRWGLRFYHPYPRRLESLAICRCHYKDSTFSSVI